jgi:hypothetical protein
MNYSPHVINSIENASVLTTQLRQIMNKLQMYRTSNKVIPVNLAKKAETLIEQVNKWENKEISCEQKCHMRFTSSTSSSPSVSQNNSPILTKNSKNFNNKSSHNLNKKIKLKYKNEWENMQKRQQRLLLSMT